MLVAILLTWSILQLVDNTFAAPWSSPISTILESRATGCAASCIQNSIQQSFPTSICANQQDINCLCTSHGLTGFTIGEELLQCIISDCPDATPDQLSTAYSICNSIPNAVQPTHATLAANIPRETTIFVQPTSLTSASTTSHTTTSSSSPTSIVTSSSAVQIAPITSTSSSAAAAATTTTTSSPVVDPILSNSQIIGLTVGLGVLALIAMVLLTYVCCFRRCNRPDSERSFSTTQPLIPQVETSSVIPPSGTSQTNPYVPSKAQSFLGQKYSLWSPATASNPIYPSYPGLATTPRPDERSTTPGSAITYQTTSKLLPEKPSYLAPSRPPRDGSEGELLTVPSPGRRRGSPSAFQASPDSFNSGPIVNRKPSDPFLQAPGPLYNPSKGTDHERTTRMNLPKLNTKTVQFAPETTPAGLAQQTPAPYNPASYAYFAETQTPDWRATQTRDTNAVQRGSALAIDPTTSTRHQESAAPSFKPVPPPKAKTTFNKYKPIPPAKARPAASTVTSFEIDDNDDTRPVSQLPPLPILRKPVPATASRSDRRPTYQYQQDSKNRDGSLDIDTPLSQVRYPTVPAITATPVSKVAKAQSVSTGKSLPTHPFIAKQRQQEQLQQSRDSPHEVSPLTPQLQRKEPFVLPHWDQDLLEQMILPDSSLHTADKDLYTRPLQYDQNAPSSPWERMFIPYPHDEFPSSPSPVDASQLLDQGFVELPDSSSNQHWNSTRPIASSPLRESKRNVSATIPRTTNPVMSRSPVPESSFVTPQKTQPAPMMLAELPSPDAERLMSPLTQATNLKSPKSESRGARLGAAMASKTHQARPRGASDGNVRDPQQRLQQPGHMRTQSHTLNTKPPVYNPPRPLEEIGLEPAARRYRDPSPRVPY